MRDSRLPMRAEWITDAARFMEIRTSWQALAWGAETPFCDHDWYACWWRAFGGGSELEICIVWDGERLVAAAPLHRRGGLAALANDHTPVFRLLADDAQSLGMLVDAIVDRRPPWLKFFAVPVGGRCLSEAVDARHGRIAYLEPTHRSPIVDTTGDLESWQATRTGDMRDLWRRRRKLMREHDVEFRFVEQHGLEFDSQLDLAFDIEASGWKGQKGTAIRSSPGTERFYRELAHVYQIGGELRLAWLMIDGEAAAFSLCLERHNRLFLVKTGYRESVRSLGPGLILNLLVTERCFETEVAAYELLGADDPWKQLLATDFREHATFWSFRRRPLPLARYALRRFVRPLLSDVSRALGIERPSWFRL